MKEKELRKELELRGTAEIDNSVVLQVTQALDDTGDIAKVAVFGKIREFKVKPIGECCAKCNFGIKTFGSIKKCQERQKKDAEIRGFSNIICPEQLEDY